jgi:phage terminase small subunit
MGGLACGPHRESSSARKAYRAAFPNCTSDVAADASGSKLLSLAKVKDRVAELLAPGAEEAGVTAARVIAEMARIAFADIRQVVSWRSEVTEVKASEGGGPTKVLQSEVLLLDSADLSAATAAAIAEVSRGTSGAIRVKLHDKPAALRDLARILGMLKDRVEHTGKDGGPLEVVEERSELEIGRRLAFVLEMIARGEIKAKLPDNGTNSLIGKAGTDDDPAASNE